MSNTGMVESRAKLYGMSDLLGEFERDSDERYEAIKAGKALGAVTGIKGLDEKIGGALGVGLHTLTGAPGTGKSALAWQMAALSGCPTVYVTCEMSPLELLRRLTCRTSGQYLNRFKNGEMTGAQALGYARDAVATVPHLSILDATKTGVSTAEIADAAELARTKPGASVSPHLLIVVDSVHAWTRGWSESSSEYEVLNSGLLALGNMARVLGAAVLGIGENSRAGMKTESMSSAAGSRVFEYSSESVFSLTTDDKKEPDYQGVKPVYLKIQKNRNGSPGSTVTLNFRTPLQQFEEVG